ncbi:hypothetical protein H2198_006757 [Neophaeococcomyces mojaviensis]|uniref:Uncharacterized protein n=1 Tax=Neophaeococcomyces mojaviensis TaxID=3383035 RepID=A0ACC3A1T7_9EURO|nr:hypothetical protein H2198_006757 [Knufia sp. JES_112]
MGHPQSTATPISDDFTRLQQALEETANARDLASKHAPGYRFAVDGVLVDGVIVLEARRQQDIRAAFSLRENEHPSLLDITLFRNWLQKYQHHDWQVSEACDKLISGSLKTVNPQKALQQVAQKPFYWSYIAKDQLNGLTVRARVKEDKFDIGASSRIFQLLDWCVSPRTGVGQCTLQDQSEITLSFAIFKISRYDEGVIEIYGRSISNYI